jgi:uncharacterized protein
MVEAPTGESAMTALGLTPDFASAFVIGVEPQRGLLGARLARQGLKPRFDRQVTLGDLGAGARSRIGYRIDQAVREADRAVLLVGSGVACAAIAWWSRLSPAHYTDRVAGALFFAAEETGQGDATAFASPAAPLNFPSAVVQGFADRPDPARAAGLALGWGSHVVDDSAAAIRAVGDRARPLHWLQRTMRDWTAAIVEHDIRTASAITR